MFFLLKKTLRMGQTSMLYNDSTDSFKSGVDRNTIVVGEYFSFNISVIYLFMMIEIGVVMVQWKINRSIPLDSLIIILFVLGMLSLNIVAGPAEFHRLNAPIYPLLILLIYKNADSSIFRMRKIQENILEYEKNNLKHSTLKSKKSK